MTRQRVMWDFFCGLGGASDAFLKACWHVVKVDNDPMFKPTILANVEDLDMAGVDPPDFAWFSPPCDEFALRRFDPTLVPSMALVEASARIIKLLKPRYWALENVRHAVPFIRRILGPHRLAVGPFFLWGNFPLFIPQAVPEKGSPRGPHWLRGAIRAKIPEALSAQMEAAVSYTLQAQEASGRRLADDPRIRPPEDRQHLLPMEGN